MDWGGGLINSVREKSGLTGDLTHLTKFIYGPRCRFVRSIMHNAILIELSWVSVLNDRLHNDLTSREIRHDVGRRVWKFVTRVLSAL